VHVSRVLQAFRADGVLNLQGNRVIFDDYQGPRQIGRIAQGLADGTTVWAYVLSE
jgi:hypothetical protein